MTEPRVINTTHYSVTILDGTIQIRDVFAETYTSLGFNYNWYGVTVEQVESYLLSLFAHVEYVRDAGRKLGISDKQLAQHDTSKFTLHELPYYARNFHGDKQDPDGFARAWLHHIHHNPHHWQHWIFPDSFTPMGSDVRSGVVEMPQEHAIEMVADWMGASMTYTGSWDMAEWLTKNTPEIRVHPKTATYLTGVLDSMGYMDYCAFDTGEL